MTSLESLGSNMSLIAWMDTFRIDIVVSEFGKSERKKSRSANKNKSGNSLLFNFIQNVFKLFFIFLSVIFILILFYRLLKFS